MNLFHPPDVITLGESRRDAALTRAGRKQVEAEVAKCERLSAGVNLVLKRT